MKTILQKIVSRLAQIWEKATFVDYESYLREREASAARERTRLRATFYGRGGCL